MLLHRCGEEGTRATVRDCSRGVLAWVTKAKPRCVLCQDIFPAYLLLFHAAGLRTRCSLSFWGPFTQQEPVHSSWYILEAPSSRRHPPPPRALPCSLPYVHLPKHSLLSIPSWSVSSRTPHPCSAVPSPSDQKAGYPSLPALRGLKNFQP